jgi:putative FmdB family regulatory protein
MPLYEYRCESCGEKFEKLLSMSAASANGISCPDCGGESRRLVSTFAAHSKGESGQTSSIGGGGCAGCGGGSCAGCHH